jgi:pimeloyl-ACP methyl ester carboxylesterase
MQSASGAPVICPKTLGASSFAYFSRGECPRTVYTDKAPFLGQHAVGLGKDWRLYGHYSRMIAVEENVNLQILDYGGSGRPLILLQGLRGVAHDYDNFAPQFTAHHHIYAITRRGFGDSGKPALSVANYAAERLGKDILVVIQSLKLNRPVLAGQSIAGEELSWIGTFARIKLQGLFIWMRSIAIPSTPQHTLTW